VRPNDAVIEAYLGSAAAEVSKKAPGA
jgi:hypothetical protein